MSCARFRMPDSADHVSGDIERVMTNSSVAVISTRCRSVSSVSVRSLEDPGLKLGVDATALGQPPMLLQLVLAVAQVSHPKDHQFGVLAGELACVQQIYRERQPREEQQPVLPEHIEQVELRGSDAAGAELGDRPVDRPQLTEATRRNAGRRAHGCCTRYGDTVLRCSLRSSARPSAGNARCGQLSRSQTRQPAPIGVALSPDKSSPSE